MKLIRFPIAAAVAITTLATTATAHPMPHNWHAPTAWLEQAKCVHEHEGAWNDKWPPYEGGMQFLLSTWLSVDGPVVRDGRGYVIHWASAFSPREQLYRTWLVWKRDGGSFREWGTAGACGLR